jgi:energy-coupling factor transporter ATP-binding protein EcfA2
MNKDNKNGAYTEAPEQWNGKNKQAASTPEPPPEGPNNEQWYESSRNIENNLPDHPKGQDQADNAEPANSTDRGPELGFDALEIKSFNTWLEESSKKPDPVRIFGPLLHEQELAILFGPEKSGKSALAVQLANAYADGYEVTGFENKAKPGSVLFMDFELTSKQQELKYKNNEASNPKSTLAQFSENLHRAEIRTEKITDDFIETLKSQIEHACKKYDLVIIDNMSWLINGIEKSGNAAPLVQTLSRLKKENGCSILIISHTTKRIDKVGQSITNADLAGSYMMSALVDSVFAINTNATDPEKRYIKQTASRSEAEIMGSESVKTLRFDKESNFLGFVWLTDEPEANHFQTEEKGHEQQFLNDVKDYMSKGNGIIKTAKKFNITKHEAQKIKDGKRDQQ